MGVFIVGRAAFVLVAAGIALIWMNALISILWVLVAVCRSGTYTVYVGVTCLVYCAGLADDTATQVTLLTLLVGGSDAAARGNRLRPKPERKWRTAATRHTSDRMTRPRLLTFEKSRETAQTGAVPIPIHVLFNSVNQGYGGNQKIGYHFAIARQFDFVALVHGDGQYAPEGLPDLVCPLREAMRLSPGVRLIASTANIGLFVSRLMLTHARFFTFASFGRLFEQSGWAEKQAVSRIQEPRAAAG